MLRKLPSRWFLLATTLATAALVVAVLFIPRSILVLGAILIGVSTAVTIYYVPAAVDALRRDRLDRVGQLALGIVIGQLSTTIARLWAAAVRVTGDHALADAPIVLIYIALGILAGALHITAPGTGENGVPKRNWIVLLTAITAGLLVACLLVWLDGGAKA